MDKLKKKLKASSVLEGLAANALLAIVSVIFSMIYVNVQNSYQMPNKLKASTELERIWTETKKEKKFIDEIIEEKNLVIKKSIEKYRDIDNIRLLKVVITNKKNKVLAERKELIINEF